MARSPGSRSRGNSRRRTGEPTFWQNLALGAYLFVTGVAAAAGVVMLFPETNRAVWGPKYPDLSAIHISQDGVVILLAACAGMLGAFLHAAHSFTTYVGNRRLRLHWFWFYIYRPHIGAALGTVFYFVVRAGLVSGTSNEVSPYGVVALGMLSGWFSKQATNKLAEVFNTLFRSREEDTYSDRLAEQPRTFSAYSADAEWSQDPDAAGQIVFTVVGTGFTDDLEILLNDDPVDTELESPTCLRALVPPDAIRGLDGNALRLRVGRRRAPFDKTEPIEMTLPSRVAA